MNKLPQSAAPAPYVAGMSGPYPGKQRECARLVAAALGVALVMPAPLASAGLLADSVGSFKVAADLSRRSSQENAAKQAASVITTFTASPSNVDTDGDAYLEPPGFVAGGGPAGGGLVPTNVGAPLGDGHGARLGYCAYNNGSVNGATANLLAGSTADMGAPVFAVVSSGLDNVFNRSCAQIFAGTNITNDDFIVSKSTNQIRQGVGGTVFFGDPVADLAALTPALGLASKDGEMRLVKSNNAIWRWNIAVGNWVSVSNTYTASNVDITGGQINGTQIGNITPSTGAFSTLTTPSATISGGTINGTAIGATIASTGVFTTLAATGAFSAAGNATFGGNVNATGSVTAASFLGNGAALTNLNGSAITTGIVSPAVGGTGLDASAAPAGSLLIGTGSGFTLAGLAAGAGIGITTGPGSILIANTGVTSFNARTGAVVLTLTDVNGVTTFGSNVTLGNNALKLSSTGSGNTGVGASALANHTTGLYNTAFGESALAANTTANNNVAIGRTAMAINTTGSENTATGTYALFGNTTGVGNAAFGFGALSSNTIGFHNVAIGRAALGGNTTGYYNTVVGQETSPSSNGNENTIVGRAAFYSATTGNNNTVSGTYAMFNSTTGSGNAVFGHGAGGGNTTGSNNTLLGSAANVGSGALSYASVLGAGATVSTSNTIALGRTTDKTVIGATGTDGTAYNLQVTGGIKALSGGINIGAGTASIAPLTLQAGVNLTTPAAGSVEYDGSNLYFTPAAVRKTVAFLDSNITGTSGNVTGIVAPANGGTGINGSTAANGTLLIGNSTGYTLANLTAGSGIGITNGAGSITIANTGVTSFNARTGAVALTLADVNGVTNFGFANSNFTLGLSALPVSSSGILNSAVGSYALSSNSTGTRNTAFGYTSALSNTSGQENVAIGVEAFGGNTTGSYNTALGRAALRNTNSNNNVATGYQAGYTVTNSITGGSSTFIGSNASIADTAFMAGSGRITLLGADASASGLASANANAYMTAIGSGASVTTANTVVLGRTTDKTVIGATGTDGTAYNLQVTGGIKALSGGLSVAGGDLILNSPTIIGLLSARPVAGTAGRIYLATDTNQLYRDDGTSWNALAAGSVALSSITAATAANTINNGANAQAWNWQLAGNTTAFNLGENVASTGGTGTQYLAKVGTLAGSTAIPLSVSTRGTEAFRVDSVNPQIVANAGTAAAPSYAFNGNQGTGFYSPGANTLAAATNGVPSLFLTNNGSHTTALGAYASSQGAGNTYIGFSAAQLAGSNYNTAVGRYALYSGGGAAGNNTAVGNEALFSTTAGNNSAFGNLAGQANTTGTYNTLIGANADVASAALTYATALGGSAIVSTSNTVVLGRTTDKTVIGATGDDGSAYNLQVTGGIKAISGGFNANNGTAAAPAYAFAGESSTGLYLPAAGELAASVAGVRSMRVTAAGSLALGAGSLLVDTSGSSTGLGTGALAANTNGGSNTAVGFQSMAANTVGGSNVAVGINTLWSNTSGSYNTAIGDQALYSNTTGNQNHAIGWYALHANTSGYDNQAIGDSALINNTTGYSNQAVGTGALRSNTTGSFNIANGSNALYGNTTGNHNVATGSFSLETNTTGFSNVGVGSYSLYSNTGGYENTASGYNSMYSNTTGYQNVGFGTQALVVNTTGFANTGVGRNAMRFNTTGYYNTALGENTMRNNNGNENTALGRAALYSGTTGNNNTVGGTYAMFSSTTGSANTAFGHGAGNANTTGSNNTFLGTGADAVSGALSYATALGAGSRVSTDNTVALGRTTDKTVIGATGTDGTAYNLQVTGGIKALSGGINIGAGTASIAPLTLQAGVNLTTPAAGSVEYDGSNLYFTPAAARKTVAFLDSNITGTSGNVTGIVAPANGGTGINGSTAANGTLLIGNSTGYTLANLTAGSGIGITNGAGSITIANTGVTSFNSRSGAVVLTKPDVDGVVTLAASAGAGGGEVNLALGTNALGGGVARAANIAIGQDALSSMTGAVVFSTTEGNNNTAVGYQALKANTTGRSNVAVGNGALAANTTGIFNLATGFYALNSNTTASNNVATGFYVLGGNTTGTGNVASGSSAMQYNTTGSTNTAAGNNAGFYNQTGSNSTFLGASTVTSNTAPMMASGRITLLGANASASGLGAAVTDAYMTAIGSGSSVTTVNTVVLGRAADTTVIGATGTTATLAGKKLQVTGDVGVLSGSSGVNASMIMGRTAAEATLAVAASNSNFSGSAITGDVILRSESLGAKLILQNGSGASALSIVNNKTVIGATGDDGTAYNLQVTGGIKALSGGIKIGAGTASIAPLTLQAGVNLTTPAAGSVEYDGSNLYFTPAAVRKTIAFLDSNITGTSGNVTGIVAPANGGTGINGSTAGNGTLLIGNSTGYTLANLTAGSGIGITNGAGSITIANTGVTSFNTRTGAVSLTLGDVNGATNFGSFNVTLGSGALPVSSSGTANTGLGNNALRSNTTGSFNDATGYGALNNNTSGNTNDAYGVYALYGNTTGSKNVAIGNAAGHWTMFDDATNTNTTGSHNTFIGANAMPGTTTQLNFATALGSGALVSTSNTIALGRTTDKTVIGATGTDGTAYNLQVTGGIKALSGGLRVAGGDLVLNSPTIIGLLSARPVAGTAGRIYLASDTNQLYRDDGTSWNALAAGSVALSSITAATAANTINNGANAQDWNWQLAGNTTAFNLGENTASTGGTGTQYLANIGTLATSTATPLRVATRGVETFRVDNVNPQIVANSGTASAPTYSFAGAQSTGFYLPAAGQLAASVGGSSGLLIRSNTTAFGTLALQSLTTGVDNVAYGQGALQLDTWGDRNNAFGLSALQRNVGGSENSAFGTVALLNNTFGTHNSGIGNYSLLGNTTGSRNTATGNASLQNNSTGSNNTAIGDSALTNNTTGSNNTTIGTSSNVASNALTYATALGSGAIVGTGSTVVLGRTTDKTVIGATGDDGTAYNLQVTGGIKALSGGVNIGAGTASIAPLTLQAGVNLTTPAAGSVEYDGSNLYFTPAATRKTIAFLDSNITGTSGNVTGIVAPANGGTGINGSAAANGTLLIGNSTGYTLANLTAGSGIGITNGAGSITVANTGVTSFNSRTGAVSLTLGDVNGVTNFGTSNVTLGISALSSNTTGAFNTAFGSTALNRNSSGSGNVGVGTQALQFNTTGSDNSAIGLLAMFSNDSGFRNLAAGAGALRNNTSGAMNLALGYQAGYSTAGGVSTNANVSGNNNTFVGANSMPGTMTQLTYATALGSDALVSTSNTIVLGRTTDKTVIGAIGTDGTAYNLQVTGGIKALSGGINIGAGTASIAPLTLQAGVNLTTPAAGSVEYDGSNLYFTPAAVRKTIAFLDSNITGTSGNVTGIVAPANGGTGINGSTAANGTLLIGNSTGYTLANLTAGSGIGITNGAGSITIANTGVTSFNSRSGAVVLTKPDVDGVVTLVASAGAGDGEVNLALGTNALGGGVARASNVAIGQDALSSMTGAVTFGSFLDGSYNTAIGYQALKANTTGFGNLASGWGALTANTTGFFNVASGSGALYANTTGTENTASGRAALFSNTTGNRNVAVGFNALGANTEGYNNIATGSLVLSRNTTGTGNVASGSSAMENNTTGSTNTAAGNSAGHYNETGSNSTFLGAATVTSNTAPMNASGRITLLGANASASGLAAAVTDAYMTAIGSGASVTTVNTIALGRTTDKTVIGATGTDGTAYNLQVTGGIKALSGGLRVAGGDLVLNSPTIIGLLSARPIAGTAGRIYLATDTNQLYRDDGTSWNALAAGSVALSSITAATTANTINNGANAQAWNWQLAGNTTAFNLGENVASTGGTGTQYLAKVGTLAGSTAIPLSVSTRGTEAFRVDSVNPQIVANAGTAAAPSYAFNGNQGTGFYSPGANTLAAATNGVPSLFLTNNGSHTTALGAYTSSQGAGNTYIGFSAAQLAGSDYNTAVGRYALYSGGGAAGNNTAVGNAALFSTTAGNNSAFGNLAGQANTTGTYNTLIGTNADVASAALTYATALGGSAIVSTSNTVVLGRTTDKTVIGATGDDGSGNRLQVTGGVGATGVLTATGGAKISVQNQQDGGVGRGIYLWDDTDTNWGLYMGQAGTARSIAGGTATASLDGRTAHAFRSRVFTSINSSFIWENSSEQALMSLTSDTGDLYTKGRVVGSSGTVAAPSFSFSGQTTTGFYLPAAGQLAASINGARAMWLTGGSLGVGLNALVADATGGSTAFGTRALEANTTGFNSTAVGYESLMANTTGQNNTALGYQSLKAVTTASNNTAVGFQALTANTIGANNLAVGMQALAANTTGSSNMALGMQALQSNTTGNDNVAIGFASLQYVTTGSRNVATGSSAGTTSGLNPITATDSVFIGSFARVANTAAMAGSGRVTVIGSGAVASGLGVATPNAYMTAIGADSSVTTVNTVVLGRAADKTVIGATGTDGTAYNLQVTGGIKAISGGFNANNGAVATPSYTFAGQNTTGFYLPAAEQLAASVSGERGMLVTTSASGGNTALGVRALNVITSGFANVAIGTDSIKSNVTGTNNTGVGAGALFNNTTNFNTAFGNDALYGNTTGQSNVGLGRGAGAFSSGGNATNANTTGGNNTFIGAHAMPGTTTQLTYATALGSDALVTTSNTIILGRTTDNVAIGQTGAGAYQFTVNGTAGGTSAYTVSSDIRFKTNIKPVVNAIETISALQGVHYEFNQAAFPDKKFESGVQLGFIAQQIEQFVPEVVRTDRLGYKSVQYSQLTPLLVEGIKAQQVVLKHLVKKDPATLLVDIKTFQANDAIFENIKAASIKVASLEAETARIKKLEADSIESKSVRSDVVKSGEMEVFVSLGSFQPIFSPQDGSQYIVNATAEDGSSAFASVAFMSGKITVTPISGKGVDVTTMGAQVGLVAPSKRIKATWIRMS